MSKKSKAGRALGMGCGLAILIAVLLFSAGRPLLLGLFGAFVVDPLRADIHLSAAPVDAVRAGDTFELEVTMHNGEDEPLDGLLYVDLSGGLYEGFDVLASQPAWVYLSDDDVHHRRKLAYEIDLPPGPTLYSLRLRARRAGRWEGELSYYRTTSRHPAGPAVPIRIDVAE